MKKRKGRRRRTGSRSIAVVEREAARAVRDSHPANQALRSLTVMARRRRGKPS